MVDLSLFQHSSPSASPAVEVNSPVQFVQFWHAAFGYPTKTLFIRNINNGNIKVSGLTSEIVRKHFMPSIVAVLGHLDATRSNVKSTKPKVKVAVTKDNSKSSVWIAVQESMGRLHGDQTGQLPVLGRHREKYLAFFLMNLLTTFT